MVKDFTKYSKEELINEIYSRKIPYGLVWENSREDVVDLCKKNLPILREEKEFGIDKNKNLKPNIIIEGDNYHVLSVLNYTHRKKFDFIYIDPPYNTGNNSWMYNNDYVNAEDTFKNSKWISFMVRRLELAKELLKEKGVICITIDNFEIHNLRHIMEKIFTDREIIISVIEHNFRGRATDNFSLTHEYAVWAVPKGEKTITRTTEISPGVTRNLRRTGTDFRREDVPTQFYGIEVDKKSLKIISVTESFYGEGLPKTKNKDTIYVWPIRDDGVEARWYYGRDRVMREANDTVYAKIISNKIQIHYTQPGKPMHRKSIWSDRGNPEGEKKLDSSTYGSELLTDIIGENEFSFPKSLYAVMECVKAGTDKKDALVLDFFAGSGTLGHAVLELNKQDGGTRRFVLSTNNELKKEREQELERNNATKEEISAEGVCRKICHPRIKNIMEGYTTKSNVKETLLFEREMNESILHDAKTVLNQIEEIKIKNESKFDEFKTVESDSLKIYGIEKIKNEKMPGLGGNLKYYQTEFVDSKHTDANKKKLSDLSTEMLCLKEDCFEKIKNSKTFSIFKNPEEKYLGIVFDDKGIIPIIEEIKKNKSFDWHVYIFALDNNAGEEDFEDAGILDRVKLKPIPIGILNAYGKIWK
jgi:adenine-specific DNA-methyltransferase